MARITDEMKEWSTRLGEEVSRWPQVTSRPMFGLRGFYRKATIFAALPVTRAIGTRNSIIFKMRSMSPEMLHRAAADPRIDEDSARPGAKWRAFELQCVDDLRDALWWLNEAYERAR